MTLFDNIKKYSKKRGMSLQEVASKAGLSKNVIYQYGKGVNPTLETLSNIAKVLDVGTDDLLGNSSTPAKSIKKNLDLDVEEAINSMRSYRGEEISESQREVLRGIIKGYLDNQGK
ncbi:helix-turn-helix domain-containing protein [Pediococcus ethanolidurans]|uniref:helix-turn-helix domain-containing protein n=1 Tax=Pediococcus ethanolidurans TaxID=319653 RepID=UPI00295594CB|nr:helix-turn-helix transcriptional regulator [Pediococcus ethanolidurans]MDV7719028.1 helix-turn-helix domain-containing protein [Pediococcus ethanolidurans]